MGGPSENFQQKEFKILQLFPEKSRKNKQNFALIITAPALKPHLILHEKNYFSNKRYMNEEFDIKSQLNKTV